MLATNEADYMQQEFERIMSYSKGHDNDATFAYMLSSWQFDSGIMPEDFGLGAADFIYMLDSHFPGLAYSSLKIPERRNDELRADECDDVFKLLEHNCAGESKSEIWMAKIVATACQGLDHLWQDMGLWQRKDLTDLLMRNFPSLASKNVKNMKWKKFIYKQLCITEGIYTCRAPSCEVCADYDNCFGSED